MKEWLKKKKEAIAKYRKNDEKPQYHYDKNNINNEGYDSKAADCMKVIATLAIAAKQRNIRNLD